MFLSKVNLMVEGVLTPSLLWLDLIVKSTARERLNGLYTSKTEF